MGQASAEAMVDDQLKEKADDETEECYIDRGEAQEVFLDTSELRTPLLSNSFHEDDENPPPPAHARPRTRGDSSPTRMYFIRDDADEAALVAAAGKPSLRQILAEAGRLTHLSFPVLCQYGFNFSLGTVSLAYVGRLGALPLAGASIATIINNVLGLSLFVGLAGGMETLCGQAYGAGRYRQVGDVTQRAILILHVVAMPMVVVLWYIEYILRYSGQDPNVSIYAGYYMRWLIPGLIMNIWGSVLEKYLQSQSIVFPLALGSGISFVLHIPINYLFIYTLDFGYVGAAMATSVSFTVNLIVLALYALVTRAHEKTWHGWSWACLRHWGQYLRIAIPSCLMTCLGWWCLDMTAFVAGYFPSPNVALSAMSICSNIRFVAFVFPLSLSVAVTIRVSNELGAGRPLRAKLCVTVAIVAATLLGLLFASILYSFRAEIPLIFTSRDEVAIREETSGAIPYVAGVHFMFWMSMVYSGLLRGSGRQLFGAGTNLVTSYIVSFPLSLYMGFVLKMRVNGLWAGMLIGNTMRFVMFLVYSWTIDWEADAHRASLETHDG